MLSAVEKMSPLHPLLCQRDYLPSTVSEDSPDLSGEPGDGVCEILCAQSGQRCSCRQLGCGSAPKPRPQDSCQRSRATVFAWHMQMAVSARSVVPQPHLAWPYKGVLLDSSLPRVTGSPQPSRAAPWNGSCLLLICCVLLGTVQLADLQACPYALLREVSAVSVRRQLSPRSNSNRWSMENHKRK